VKKEELGRVFQDGEIIVRQGDKGDCLFIIQEGQVQIFIDNQGEEILLRTAGKNELIGEMAIFRREVRSATARAFGQVRVLTLDKSNFLKRITEEPSLAFRIIEALSKRITDLSIEVAKLKSYNGKS
jgi:CRP/FNR family transcriptional regulator